VLLVPNIVNLGLVVLIHQFHRRTDRRTDVMQSQYRALHYSASHGKKVKFLKNSPNLGSSADSLCSLNLFCVKDRTVDFCSLYQGVCL